MNAIIKITEQPGGDRAVSARELHEYLEVKTDFTDWCKRMFEYGFDEGKDYIILLKNGEKVSKSNPIDYALTLDAAKEISMLQRSEKGKQARQYFIEVEKAATKPMTQIELLVHSAQLLAMQDKRMNVIEDKVLQIEAKATTRPDYFTVAGYAVIRKVKVNVTLAATLGRKASAMCKAAGHPIEEIHDPRFGKVGSYPADILCTVFNNI